MKAIEEIKIATRVSVGTERLLVPEDAGDVAVIVVVEDGEVAGESAEGCELVGVVADGETASILSFINYISLHTQSYINRNTKGDQ